MAPPICETCLKPVGDDGRCERHLYADALDPDDADDAALIATRRQLRERWPRAALWGGFGIVSWFLMFFAVLPYGARWAWLPALESPPLGLNIELTFVWWAAMLLGTFLLLRIVRGVRDLPATYARSEALRQVKAELRRTVEAPVEDREEAPAVASADDRAVRERVERLRDGDEERDDAGGPSDRPAVRGVEQR